MKEALQTSIEGGVDQKKDEAKHRVRLEAGMLDRYPNSDRGFVNRIATQRALYEHFKELI